MFSTNWLQLNRIRIQHLTNHPAKGNSHLPTPNKHDMLFATHSSDYSFIYTLGECATGHRTSHSPFPPPTLSPYHPYIVQSIFILFSKLYLQHFSLEHCGHTRRQDVTRTWSRWVAPEERAYPSKWPSTETQSEVSRKRGYGWYGMVDQIHS